MKGGRGGCLDYSILFAVLLYFIASWIFLGSIFYDKLVPFYDSLSYQADYLRMVDLYRFEGYFSVLKAVILPRTTFSYTIFSALFIPFFPRSIFGLYFVIYGLIFISFTLIFYLAKKITNSSVKALSFIFLIVSSTMISFLYGGILDQRLDLLAGVMLLAALMASYCFIKEPQKFLSWLILLLANLLCLIHRLTTASQVALLSVTIVAFNFARIPDILKTIRLKHIITLFLGLGLLIVLVYPSLDYLNYYYFKWNIDVGKALPLSDVMGFAFSSVHYLLGGYIILLIIILLGINLFKKKFGDIIFSIALFVASLLPFIITRSGGNRFVFFTAALVLLFSYLLLIKNIQSRTFAYFLLFITFISALSNLSALRKAVEDIDIRDRQILNVIADDLSSSADQVFISGTVPVAPSIIAINNFFGNQALKDGKYMFHSPDYGLPKVYSPDLKLLQEKINVSLEDICKMQGYVILPADGTKNDQNAYLFSFKYAELIRDEFRNLNCLGEEVRNFMYENKNYTIFKLKGSYI